MPNARIITSPLAALLGAAAFASPAAAVPADPVSTGPPSPATPPPIVQPAAPVDVRPSGFDWGSAGIGAAGGVGAFAIALAGTAGMRRRRLAPPGPVGPH